MGTAFADDVGVTPKSGDLAFWEELAFWETIKNTTDPAELEAYLAAYPKGRFVSLAKLRLESLRSGDAVPAEPTAASNPEDQSAREIGGSVRSAPESSAVNTASAPEASGSFRDCDDCPLMVTVPAGRYLMGSDTHRPEEKPRHEVVFEKPFAIGAREITVGEWDACLREGRCDFSPETAGGAELPVSNVSWDDAQQYIAWLTDKTGHEYRLPSEAEWEYAASGGTSTAFWWGDEVGTNNANCSDCGSDWDGKAPAPTGSFKPNPFGLYDVHGNLWEWTMDCMNRSYEGAPADGSAWLRGDCLGRMLRGGSWNLESDYMRTTRRHNYDRDVRYYLHGFRVVRSLP